MATWRHGTQVGVAVLILACALIAGLISRLGLGILEHDRIVIFVGAWGVLFVIVGKLRQRNRRRGDE